MNYYVQPRLPYATQQAQYSSNEINMKRVLSLFSGCGGMDLGFEGDFSVHKACVNERIHPNWINKNLGEDWVHLDKTGFQTVFANDIVRSAEAAWVPYFGNRGAIEEVFRRRSIVDLVKQHRNGGGSIFPKAIDVITGGFPCQDFSLAGKRKGLRSHKNHKGELLTKSDDPSVESRGSLYMWMREVIDIVRPKMFIAENVKGLASLGDVKTLIEKDFASIGEDGYLVVNARVLHAVEYGVPQTRERIFFIGFLKTALKQKAMRELSKDIISPEYDPYPLPTHYLNGNGQEHSEHRNDADLLPPVPSKTVLLDLPEPESADVDLAQANYSKARYYGAHCQGQKEINLDAPSITIRAEHHGNIEFRRLSRDHGGKNLEELEKGLNERRLSVRECARIQTFPDNFEFVRKPHIHNGDFKISASEAYKLIGNAVPPLLAFHLAMRLNNLWSQLFKK